MTHLNQLTNIEVILLPLIPKIPTDNNELSMNSEWAVFHYPISGLPHFKQTLYNGLIINNSITVFNLPIDTYLCSLNTTCIHIKYCIIKMISQNSIKYCF